MGRYLLGIQYKGTKYHGWQCQNEKRTIQGVLEEKLKIILREDIKLFVAGRTDAGVHARKQFAHFDLFRRIEEEKIMYSLNALLKEEDVCIFSINEVNENFHARFWCKEKTYKYYMQVSKVRDIFQEGLYWQIPRFDLEKANLCASFLEGEHDFQSFRDSHCQAKHALRGIELCNFQEKDGFIFMEIKAKSFLHHQIRIIIGTIVEIILREESPEKILEILNEKNRQFAGPTAPARGLFLEDIVY